MLGRKRESILQREWKTKDSKSVWAKAYPRNRRPYVLGPDYVWTNVILILGSSCYALLELEKARVADVAMVRTILTSKFDEPCAKRIAGDAVCTKVLSVHKVAPGSHRGGGHIEHTTM